MVKLGLVFKFTYEIYLLTPIEVKLSALVPRYLCEAWQAQFEEDLLFGTAVGLRWQIKGHHHLYFRLLAIDILYRHILTILEEFIDLDLGVGSLPFFRHSLHLPLNWLNSANGTCLSR